MTATFSKTAGGDQIGQPLYEAAGLAWLREGGARVPDVISVDPRRLVTTVVPPGYPSEAAARDFGRHLAFLHASGAPHYGCPPPNYTGEGWMGRARLPFCPAPLPWGQFYSHYRIRPYLGRTFTSREKALITRLCETLESGDLDHPEPALVREADQGAARIHGDLWNGNVLWSPDGAVLIDPAAQGGHAEEDLATLHTFGAPYLDSIIEGYQSVSPLAPGWEQRTGLHQLHILMVHCYLFGRGYVPETLSIVTDIVENP